MTIGNALVGRIALTGSRAPLRSPSAASGRGFGTHEVIGTLKRFLPSLSMRSASRSSRRGDRERFARHADSRPSWPPPHHDETERLKWELAELAVRIRRLMSHLETVEADTHARAEIRSGLRELAALKARRDRELEAAERASHALFVRRGAVSYEPQERCAGRCFDICSGKRGDVAQLVEHLFCN